MLPDNSDVSNDTFENLQEILRMKRAILEKKY
jgi:hypothetical protein